MSDVDLFDGIEDDSATDSPAEETTSENEVEVSEGTETSEVTEEVKPATEDTKPPVEVLNEIPAGCVSVTDFAQFITTELMRKAFESGEGIDGTEFTVPQAVYQTVKASRDPIPHVLVKGPDDKEARVYILKDAAFEYWMARREKLKERGVSGSTKASNRTSEENLALLEGAVVKSLYAQTRLKMWTEKVEQTEKLVEKYKGFLKDQEVNTDTVDLAIQTATSEFEAEQKAKADEKAAKAKKSGEPAVEDNA